MPSRIPAVVISAELIRDLRVTWRTISDIDLLPCLDFRAPESGATSTVRPCAEPQKDGKSCYQFWKRHRCYRQHRYRYWRAEDRTVLTARLQASPAVTAAPRHQHP